MQKKEWLCDRFINSLDTKEKLNESKEENRSPSRKRMGFPTRFIDALLSVDKDHGNETNKDSPNACKTTGEPVSMFSGVEMSLPAEAGAHDDEETFKAVERLPQVRKRSLIMSIFGRLMGLDDCDAVNDKLSDRPEEVMEHCNESTIVEVSSSSGGTVINHSYEASNGVAIFILNEDLNYSTNGQQGSQHKTVGSEHFETPETDFGRDPASLQKAVGVENRGFVGNETKSQQTSADEIVERNVGEVCAIEVTPKSSQAHCGVESGTLMNSKSEPKSTSPVNVRVKTVRVWLKDINLYKVITLFSFTLSN